MDTKIFWRVYKDLSKVQGIDSSLEMLIVAQVLEWESNNRECFESDASMAEHFRASESTVSRAIKKLVDKGLLTKTLKNTQTGRIRILKSCPAKLAIMRPETQKNKLNSGKPQSSNCLDDISPEESQQANCLSATVNLTVPKQQNDSLKDKREEDKRLTPQKDKSSTTSDQNVFIRIFAEEFKTRGLLEGAVQLQDSLTGMKRFQAKDGNRYEIIF